MATCVVFYLRTDNPSVIEKHLSENLHDWEWAISIEPTTAQAVHDSHLIDDSSEPNWHTWYSYIPLSETYGSNYPGHNFKKALIALHGVKNVISDILISDSTTGEAGIKLSGEADYLYFVGHEVGIPGYFEPGGQGEAMLKLSRDSGRSEDIFLLNFSTENKK